MELMLDQQRNPDQGPTWQPWRSWNAGLAAGRDPWTREPRGLPSSALAECECPDDCLRDHEND